MLQQQRLCRKKRGLSFPLFFLPCSNCSIIVVSVLQMQCHGQENWFLFPTQSFSLTLLPGQWEKKTSFLLSYFWWQQHCCSSLQVCKRKSNMYVLQSICHLLMLLCTGLLVHICPPEARRVQSPERQAWTRCRSPEVIYKYIKAATVVKEKRYLLKPFPYGCLKQKRSGEARK